MDNREILLELYRKFSKDEMVQLLKQELSSADIRNGILKSEISELKDKINKMNEQPKKTKEAKEQILELKIEMSLWKSRYFELLGKQHLDHA